MAAALFVALSNVRLDAQGLYYDELHAAAPAFAYVGLHPRHFSLAEVFGIPLMSTEYGGALKTAIYGLVLRAMGGKFDVVSYRLTGIVLAGIGIAWLVAVFARRSSLVGAAVLASLLLTDISMILATRHDWGPTALGLALRCLLVALYVSGVGRSKSDHRYEFLLGALAGLAIFEKLLSVLLLVPFAVMLISDRNRRTLRRWLAALAGLAVGLTPLLIANLVTWFHEQRSVTLVALDIVRGVSRHPWPFFWREYLSLGSGVGVQGWILGVSRDAAWPARLEPVVMGFLLGLVAVAIVWGGRRFPWSRMAGVLLICYLGIGVGLYLVPGHWVHHWLLGTPFQYVAIALLASACVERPQRETVGNAVVRRVALSEGAVATRWCRAMTLLVIGGFIIVRMTGVALLERSLWQGAASETWDLSLTTIGRFAAQLDEASIVVSTDWGLGIQGYCLSNGRFERWHEFDWGRDPAAFETLRQIIRDTGARKLYVAQYAAWETPASLSQTDEMLQAIERLGDWQAVPVEDEVAGLRSVAVWKFVRSPSERPLAEAPMTSVDDSGQTKHAMLLSGSEL